MISLNNPIVTKEDLKKKKKQKNAVLSEIFRFSQKFPTLNFKKFAEPAEELGMRKGKFETVNRFVKRIEGTLHSRINEGIAIAKHGLAGRKQEEIDADYKKIDDAEKRKKDQERREIENKIKEAKKKREEEAKRRDEMDKAREQRKAEKRKVKETPEEPEDVEDDDEDDSDDDEDGPKPKNGEKPEETQKKAPK